MPHYSSTQLQNNMSDNIDVVVPFADVTEEDKIEFYKAFLSDEPFTLETKLFGDKYTIKFKSLTIKESTDVFDQLKKDQVKGTITSDATYMMALTNYRLAQGIVSVNDAPFQADLTAAKYKPKDESDSYVKEKAEVFRAWPVFKLSAVADAFKVFEDKLLFLTKEIQNENFWAAAK